MENVRRRETPVPSGGAGINLDDIRYTFPGQEDPVIDGLTLQIEPGEFIAVIGPSGCGKTTLLRLIHGLLPPDAGIVSMDGSQITRPSRRRGFVFQSDCLLPWRRIIDNVAFPLQLAKEPKDAARARAQEMLDRIGLGHTANKFPSQLSGGMRQRVNIARALAVSPDVLLMDEPFAALDAQTREVLQTELLRIWAQEKKTVVFVTHQLDEAVYLADRVVVLLPHPGRVGEVVPINLPRPRELDIKRTAEFTEIVEHLWGLIKTDVLAEAVV
ncbi:ABC transporter ATP-binding protein [Microbacterium sp. YY-01]|uniref:ABC transporter ATP-binding protein n=1 Tax=Microbacterium sp. YY-01 TaxID=3421634 RepID=UPI003D175AC8